jgi:hypothetical protein
MARKKKVLTTEQAVSASVSHAKEVIQPLSVDFGREDLNTLGTKLNEIIMYINRHGL